MVVVAPGSRQVWASNHSPHYACIHLESSWTSLGALLTSSIFNLDEDQMRHVGLSQNKFPNDWSNDQDLFVRTSAIVSVLYTLFKYNITLRNKRMLLYQNMCSCQNWFWLCINYQLWLESECQQVTYQDITSGWDKPRPMSSLVLPCGKLIWKKEHFPL